jgi:hypothetical protein
MVFDRRFLVARVRKTLTPYPRALQAFEMLAVYQNTHTTAMPSKPHRRTAVNCRFDGTGSEQ